MKDWERKVMSDLKERLVMAEEIAMPAEGMWELIHIIELQNVRLAKRDALIAKLRGELASLKKRA